MLLALIPSKQFTKRWPDVAQSGDERSRLPAAVDGRRTGSVLVVRDHDGQQLACVYFENEPGRQSSKVMRASSDVRFRGQYRTSFRRR